ncbi:hypothetical protein JXM83_03745 [Candidatus Woesearchaeota archaeon]|nr:hypothetical protein [Candidatus Woesearchaeota archaeon]
MKTLTDFLGCKIDGFVEFDLKNYKDQLFALTTGLTCSIIMSKPLVVKNLDFLNERIQSILDAAKDVSDGKYVIEDSTLKFVPSEINYSLKEFSYNGANVLDITKLLFPILMFSPKNQRFKITGTTEYKQSIDYFKYFVVPYLSKFVTTKINVIRRSFVSNEIGEIEISINPKFKYNDSIYDQKITENFKCLKDFIDEVKTKVSNVNFNLRSNLSPLLIRGEIYGAFSSSDYIINDIYKMVDLILKRTKKSVSIKPEFSKRIHDGISITVYAILCEEDDMDFTMSENMFNILGRSIVYNKINTTTQTRIIEEIEKFVKDIEKLKQRYKDLDNSLDIYSKLFGEKKKSEYSKLISKFF